MQINLRHKGSVTILDIEGNLVGPNTIALKNIIDDQIRSADSEPVYMILNMERVQMMDSSGIGSHRCSLCINTTQQRQSGLT